MSQFATSNENVMGSGEMKGRARVKKRGAKSIIIERSKDELIIRIPEKIDTDGPHNFIDYLKVKTITAKSRSADRDIEKISSEINKSWWEKNKDRFVK